MEEFAARDAWLRHRKSFLCDDLGLDCYNLASMCCWCRWLDFPRLVSLLQRNQHHVVGCYSSSLAALVVFHDKMNGVKVIAMLLALCGFASYIYQNYLDDTEARRLRTDVRESHDNSSC
ncbi:hypothetical protein V6N13_002858 [Hibiscus sabdariffa]